MKKAQAILGVPVRKPLHLYRFKNHPYLSMSFDGVGEFFKPVKKVIDPKAYLEEVPDQQGRLQELYRTEPEVLFPAPDFSFVGRHHGYAPVEIKVATMLGQKHYNPVKAIYNEARMLMGIDPCQEAPKPLALSELQTMSVEEKAAYFGIPVYYYPQVQQEMMAVDANGGFLAVMFETEWQIYIFYVQKDPILWNQIINMGLKAAQAVNNLAAKEGRGPIMALTPEMDKQMSRTRTELQQEMPRPSPLIGEPERKTPNAQWLDDEF